MSVNIEWKTGEDGRSGVVAEGTYLWDAAKRLGLRLPAECEGRGECDTCAVVVVEGAALLSELTEAERERLSPERLLAGERLACQARAALAGNLVLRPVPAAERTETTAEVVRDLRKEFAEMPLRKKLTTLVELEANAAIHTLVSAADLPFTAFEKGLEFIAGFGRQMSRRERDAKRPAEHRQKEAEAPAEEAKAGE
jgi:ferredoxin